LVKALERCDLRLFVAANVCSFVIRWLADTYLFARLFSFFHGRTTYREVLPASTAQYFLQAVNVLVADGAMVLFLHKRKGVEWLVALPYAVAALGFFLCAALWWMRGRPASRPARWLWTGRGMRAFRSARPYHYGVLGLIRMAIYIPNAVAFYLYFVSFRLNVPLAAVLAMSPALTFAQSAPVTPSGLGPLQAVMVDGFAQFAPRGELLTVALGVSIVQLLCRIPMGVGAAGTFARKVLTAERTADNSTTAPGASNHHTN